MEEEKKGSQSDDLKSEGLRISRTTLPDDARLSSSADQAAKEDNFLKVLHRQSRELSMVINLEGKIKYCSQAIKSLLGYDSSRLIGNNVRELIPLEQWVAFRAALRASEDEAEEPILIDCSFIDINNKRQRFSVSVVDFREHPLVEGYIINAHQTTRVKRLEERLDLREAAIACIKEAVVVIDPERKNVLYANEAFFELSGFSHSEIMGGKLDLFKPPYSEMLFDLKTSAKEIEKFQRAIKNQSSYQGMIYSKKKNGTVFYNRFSLKPIFDQDEELKYYVATANETRERKRRSTKKKS